MNRKRDAGFDAFLAEAETFDRALAAGDINAAIAAHDHLTARVHALRADDPLGEAARATLEGSYFSRTQRLLALARKPRDRAAFGDRYRAVWRGNLPLFAIVAQFFLLALVAGAYLGWHSPEYAGLFLPQEILERIARGEDWFGSLRDSPLRGGLAIAANNMGVCLRVFLFSAFLAVGGLALTAYNGFHVGFVIGYGLRMDFGEPLARFMTTHGLLELTLIVASCFAGMVMAREFFRRGPPAFGERFRRAAGDGFCVALGILPWLCAAAAFEALVSPWDFVPYRWKIGISLFLAAAFWLYTFLPVRGGTTGTAGARR